MNISKVAVYTVLGLITNLSLAHAAENEKWFVRSHLANSQVSSQSVTANNIAIGVNRAEIDIDNGFAAGLGIGYQLNQRWAAELGWEYRSNDAETLLDNGQAFADGNYASNIFYLNGIYSLAPKGKWQPYVGLGLTWVQEIDVDVEQGATERSFSDGGYTGYQLFTGVNRSISNNLLLQGEVRYGAITGIDLDEESGDGRLIGLDYKPLTLQVGLKYDF